MTQISLGLDTFGDVSLGVDGKPQSMDQTLREVLDQAVLADEIGIDFIGLGEHHRPDFAISAPEIVLAAHVVRDTDCGAPADARQAGIPGSIHAIEQVGQDDRGLLLAYPATRP